jgi:DNA-binding transcriptional MerR regulator/methylmalonyl-CoA mutase cobalamin-binding subunit
MYTIKEASTRTGISVAVLRAWERRYGVVVPRRTARGYRLYDDAAIERLRAMQRLVRDGWSPSAAAGHLEGLSPEAAAALTRASSRPTHGTGETALAQRFVEAAANRDGAAVEATLDEMLAQSSFESAMDGQVMPALVALGEAWQRGRLDVAAEHAASAAVLHRLGTAFQAAGRARGATSGPVLVGLPSGSHHELGALAFAVAARRAGLPVVYLGADLPTSDWVRAARAMRARAVVVGVVTAADHDQAGEVVAALGRDLPSVRVAVGGRASASVVAGDAVLRLPEGLAPAVAALEAALG